MLDLPSGTSTSAKLKIFYSHCDEECLELLKGCSVSEVDSSILMVPPVDQGQKHYEFIGNELRLRRKKFIKAAQQSSIKHITIMVRGGKQEYTVPQFSNPHDLIMHSESGIVTPTSPKIQTVTDNFELFKEVYSWEGSASILRMSDNRGLFSNQRVELASGVRPNDWLKLKHEDYWPADELSKYIKNLHSKVEMRGYQYTARLITGVLCQYVVDVRLIFYNGDLARLVKVHSCVPLE